MMGFCFTSSQKSTNYFCWKLSSQLISPVGRRRAAAASFQSRCRDWIRGGWMSLTESEEMKKKIIRLILLRESTSDCLQYFHAVLLTTCSSARRRPMSYWQVQLVLHVSVEYELHRWPRVDTDVVVFFFTMLSRYWMMTLDNDILRSHPCGYSSP